jgi:cardiolipin synthase
MSGVLTIPNAVSFVRLLAVPYFWWVTVGQRNIALAAVLIFVIGATDWVDGFLARKLDQVTEVGKLLDPLADRLMIASSLLAGLIVGVVPLSIGIPLLVREALVAIGAAYLAGRGGGKLDVRVMGKLATFLLYGAIPSFYLAAAEVVPALFGPAAWVAGVVGLVLYYWVGWTYVGDIRRALAGRDGVSSVGPG